MSQEPIPFLTRSELKKYVAYSNAHLIRLEKAGAFPRRVKLGLGRGARVAWPAPLVAEWQRARLKASGIVLRQDDGEER